MSNFNWCHGPECHTKVTTDRVRGSKGSKVLRTRKITQSAHGYPNGVWRYFCSTYCYNDFAHKHVEQLIRIEPRLEPLETPIEDPKKETTEYSYGSYTRTIINKLDTTT